MNQTFILNVVAVYRKYKAGKNRSRSTNYAIFITLEMKDN